MMYTIFLGKQGKRVYTIGPERRVYTIEPQTQKNKKGGSPRWWCKLFSSLLKISNRHVALNQCYCRDQKYSRSEKCFEKFISEKLLIFLMYRPCLGLIIFSSHLQALLFLQDKSSESVRKLLIPVKKS